MYLFLIPVLLGFAANLASAFTAAYSHWWGARRGSWASAILRNVLGIPVWGFGFLLAARAPSASLFAATGLTGVPAWILIITGGAIILAALAEIRLRAAKPTTGDALACHGVYAYVRHPIHTGMLLELAGLFLLMPTRTVTLACVLGVLWVSAQTFCEEFDLLQRLPGYRAYMQAVPRFLPRLHSPRASPPSVPQGSPS